MKKYIKNPITLYYLYTKVYYSHTLSKILKTNFKRFSANSINSLYDLIELPLGFLF